MKLQVQLFAAILITLPSMLMAQSGIVWNATTDVNSMSMYGNLHPRIVLDRSGDPLILWGRDANDAAYFSRWNGAAFTTPAMVNTTRPAAVMSWAGPDITAHGDTVYIVIKETPEMDSSIYVYRSFDGGISFSTPVKVDINVLDSISRFPNVTTDDNGNPIIAFIKMNPDMSNARWVVTRSNNFGTTFSTDVLASDWSGGDVCDCCPASITHSGSNVAVMYRDNNSNIRDMWTGISTNDGVNFNNGFALDSPNWFLPACPSSGPDGIIIGDKLYSVLMSGFSGTYLTYFSESTLSALGNDTVMPLTGAFAGLTVQNYPRIANSGNAVGIVWKQTVSGQAQIPLIFTNDINSGLPTQYDTIDLDNATNVDIAMGDGIIHIVWQDDVTGTVKYRSGTFTPTTGFDDCLEASNYWLYPNPTSSKINLQVKNSISGNAELFISDLQGKVLQTKFIYLEEECGLANIDLDVSTLANGMYIITLVSENQKIVTRFIKQ